LLGFFDCLLHVKMLLLIGVSGEDGKLVELNAPLKNKKKILAK
jgi:hypothetical protein